ncbi:MAG: hypothetical protein DRI46_13585 [Chloroflexi bacterium]|nr:MAG: hypothetical protein DRI46_13585 [Chloroflexota bacterium]
MKALISHKKARFDFEILDTFEAGIVLLGTKTEAWLKIYIYNQNKFFKFSLVLYSHP